MQSRVGFGAFRGEKYNSYEECEGEGWPVAVEEAHKASRLARSDERAAVEGSRGRAVAWLRRRVPVENGKPKERGRKSLKKKKKKKRLTKAYAST